MDKSDDGEALSTLAVFFMLCLPSPAGYFKANFTASYSNARSNPSFS